MGWLGKLLGRRTKEESPITHARLDNGTLVVITATERKILECLVDQTDAISPTAIADETGIPVEDIIEGLHNLSPAYVNFGPPPQEHRVD